MKKAAMFPPTALLAAGVPVCRAVQQPRQFVVTLPQAYHAGFSHGFNTAEAVNFMLTDWLPYAEAASARYRMMAKEPVLDVDQILVKASMADHSREVHAVLHAAVAAQIKQRKACAAAGIPFKGMDVTDKAYALGRGPPCAHCGHVCHFGFVQVGYDRTPGLDRQLVPGVGGKRAAALAAPQLVCAAHAAQLESEPRVLFTRYDDKHLASLLARAAEGKAKGPRVATLQPPAKAPPLPKAVERAFGASRERRKGKRQSK